MPDDRATTFAHVGRRAVQALLTTVIAVPIWIFFRGGLSDAFTSGHIGYVALAMAVGWILIFGSDLIVDGLTSLWRRRKS